MPDLPSVPYHQQEFPAYCGAACAQMVLKSLPPGTQPIQRQMDLFGEYEDNSADTLVAWGMAPDEIEAVMDTFQPAPPPAKKPFVLKELTHEVDISLQIVQSISNHQAAAIALVFDWRHWVVVRGYDTSSTPPGIGALYINDPWPPLSKTSGIPANHGAGDGCGSGGGPGKSGGTANRQIPYPTWQSDYMTGVPAYAISKSKWAGKFLAICDPDNDDEQPPSPPAGPDAEDGPDQPDDSTAVSALILPNVAQQVAGTGLNDPKLREREPWKTVLQGPLTLGDPILVQRLDRLNSYYYIVPASTPGGEVPIAVRVDAVNGTYMEAVVAMDQDSNAIPEFKMNAAVVLAKSFGSGQNSITIYDDLFALYPTLVWQPCVESFSPFYPFYMVVVGANQLFITADGSQLYTELHDNIAGF